jgi:outer membrane protein TolC
MDPQKLKNNMKKSVLLFLFISLQGWSQTELQSSSMLTLDDFLGYVKQFHPLVKQANLEVSQAQSEIIAARGGFDPKIEVDYEKKQFKSTEYFDLLNSTFKIPTWYGIEVKAGFDQMEGVNLNPQNITPLDGLATVGIAIPVGQGLFINKRMADLRKAKLYNELSQAERDLEVANILHQACFTYFDWYRNYNEYQLYVTFLKNAQIRFDGIRNLIKEGDRPAIDSVEAGILIQTRKLSLEQSRIKTVKSRLELSNYLWLENTVPVELQDTIIPETAIEKNIESTLQTNGLLLADLDFANHPKIRALQNKVNILDVDRRLKGDMLKPRIDLNYNFLQESTALDNFNTDNYKYGLSFSLPLFLRKERGNFQVAKFRVQDAELDLQFENVALKNKIDYQIQEISSLQEQISLTGNLVNSYQILLNSEERLFIFGESSIFLINTRENSLLSSSIEQLEAQVRFCQSNADLFRLLANSIN